jgi:hypothetical protein
MRFPNMGTPIVRSFRETRTDQVHLRCIHMATFGLERSRPHRHSTRTSSCHRQCNSTTVRNSLSLSIVSVQIPLAAHRNGRQHPIPGTSPHQTGPKVHIRFCSIAVFIFRRPTLLLDCVCPGDQICLPRDNSKYILSRESPKTHYHHRPVQTRIQSTHAPRGGIPPATLRWHWTSWISRQNKASRKSHCCWAKYAPIHLPAPQS